LVAICGRLGQESHQLGIVALLKAVPSDSARNVNLIMTAAYWEIGRSIVILEHGGEHPTECGEQLVEQLAGDLTCQFHRGFGRANLWQMRAFYRAWPESQILQTLSGEFVSTVDFNIIAGNSSTISNLESRSALVRLCAAAFDEEHGCAEVPNDLKPDYGTFVT
jgi:DUF1016 N-terminal domain